jgi:hypothetical protein
MTIEVMFFDVDCTLLFPDREKTLVALWKRGLRPTEAQFFVAECWTRKEMDQIVSQTAA